MEGDWAQAGGSDGGGALVFEATGAIDLRTAGKLIPQRIFHGKGVVAVANQGTAGFFVLWRINRRRGRFWEGAFPAGVVGGAGMDGTFKTSIVYENNHMCFEPSDVPVTNFAPKTPVRQLWFSSKDADAFRSAVTTAATHDW